MMFCKHEWQVLSETTTQSKAEYAKKLGFLLEDYVDYAFERKHICILKCAKCGRLKRFVEEL